MSNIAYVYRLYPDKQQNTLLQKTFGCARFVYNQMLAIQEKRYVSGQNHMTRTDANNYCNRVLKNEFPFLREVDKFALTNAVYHLSDGYGRFFKKLGRHPRFKNKHKAKKSYTTNMTNGNISIGENFVKLPKLGKVKAVIHRAPNPDWQIKSATVTNLRDGSFQVSVLFEYHAEAPVPKAMTESNTLGLDYKSDGLYVDEQGNCPHMEHFYRNLQPQLAKRQRKLKHKTPGSANYEKAVRSANRIHRKIANQRNDFLHKQSTAIAKQYDFVMAEDINMRLLSNKSFGNGKATLDNGYGKFLSLLEYKLANKGGALIRVDKWYPSSQLCSSCGCRNIRLKDLSIRK